MATDKNPRKELVDTIINSMKNRDGVWQKTWANLVGSEAPYNPITGTKYRGVNFLVLSLEQTELDTIDPRWCTFKQAVAAGYQITRGSKAAQASFYDLNVSLNDGSKDYYIKAKSVDGYVSKVIDHYRTQYPAKSTEIRDAVNKAAQFTTLSDKAKLALFVTELNKATGADIKILSAAVMKSFPIFNYSQLQNVPALEIKPINNFEPIHRAEGILVASGAKIFHDNANENYYSPKKHEIHLTPKESFKSPEAYYSTALHEIGHWTKGDGLPRNLKVDGEVNTDRLAYAREELRAELASVFMSSDLNLKLDIQNHSAYLGSYLEVLNNDYTEFFAAVSDAQKIASHVIGFEKRMDLESTEAKELQTNNPELYQKIVEYNAQTALLTTEQPANDFEVGDVYITKWQGEIRKFEITEIDNSKLTVLDQAVEIPLEHTRESFQQMLNDYGCEKLDTLSPQVLLDSDYLVYGQELLNKEFNNVARQDIEGVFIFDDADTAQQFIDKLTLDYNVPSNTIHSYNFDRSNKHLNFINEGEQGFPVAIDSKYYAEAQKLFTRDYMMSGDEDPQLGFVFSSDDEAIEFIDKLTTELNIPKSAINDYDLTRPIASEILPANIWGSTKSPDSAIIQPDYLVNIANKTANTPAQVQIEARKPAHEALKDMDTSDSTQKPNSNKAYLETFFEEKNLPFKEFIVTHNEETHFIPNDAVIDYVINSLDSVNQGKVKDVLVKLDFANADINHFLEHCATGMVLQRAADLDLSESAIKVTLDSTIEKPMESTDASFDASVDRVIDDDNDFSR